MTKLVIGCGYLGHRVARAWLREGAEVAVITRNRQRAESLQAEGFRALVADVCEPESLKRLPEAQTVVHAVGYDPAGSFPRRAVMVDGLRNVLDCLSPDVGRLLLISSTGVLGGHAGNWIDETASCHPEREAGRCHLEAEWLLAAHVLGRRSVVLRMAGIYGPGRLPKAVDVLAGKPVASPVDAYLNLIHVDDAVRTILAAETEAAVPNLFLVSDGCPTTHREFYQEMARQLGVAPPRFCPPVPGSRGASAAAGNKRVSNRKMLDELEIELEFPDFRKGLAAVCREHPRPARD